MGSQLHSEMPENDDLKNYYILDYNKVEYKPMKEEVKKQDQVEVMIASQLSQFEVKEEDLKEKVAEYSILAVTGVDDKAGRKAVSEARKHLKTIRTGITNTGKDLRENFNKVSKAIISREKDLIAITLPEEQRLEQIESDIAEEEEEIRKQKEHEEQERIIARTKLLEGYGATFNGVQYQLGDHTITMAEVRLFTETEFARVETFFREDFEKEQQMKIWAAEQASLKYDLFLEVLFEDGWGWDEGDLISKGNGYIINPDDFKLWTEDDLKARMESVNAKIKQFEEEDKARRIANEALEAEQAKLAEIAAQQKAQQEELDRKQKELDDQLAAVKAQQEKDAYNAKVNLFESRRTQLMNTPNLLVSEEINNIYSPIYSVFDGDWILFLDKCKSDFEKDQELLTKEAEEAAAAEEKRRIEMAPDVDVLKELVDKLKKTIIPKPVMKTQKGSATLNNAATLIGKTVTYIEEQIKEL